MTRQISWLPQTSGGEAVARSKLPEVTAPFWIVNVLTAGMGETTSDFLVHRIDPPIAVAGAGLALAGALALQLAVRRYVAWVYWLAVVLVSIFGTMAAAAVHGALGANFGASTLFFAVFLAGILLCWHATEKTLSLHGIRTARREAFYWAAVLATFALGAAAGDMAATVLGLGYLASGVLFAFVILVPMVAYGAFGLGEIPAFWFAYVVTRPLGAFLADWVGVPPQAGGLGFGTGPTSLGLAVLIVGFVAFALHIPGRADISA